MFTAVLTLSLVSALDVVHGTSKDSSHRAVTGLRDEQPGVIRDAETERLMINGYGLHDEDIRSWEQYRGAHQAIDNHLDIKESVRAACVTGEITNINPDGSHTVRAALEDGDACHWFGTTEASCNLKYEAKYRGNHRPNRPPDNYDAYSIYGEVHLCEWITPGAGPTEGVDGSCEAGKGLTICPEWSLSTPYVVEVKTGLGNPAPTLEPTTNPDQGGHHVGFTLQFPCSHTQAEIDAQIEDMKLMLASVLGVLPSQITITYLQSSCGEAAFAESGQQPGIEDHVDITLDPDVPGQKILVLDKLNAVCEKVEVMFEGRIGCDFTTD